MKLQRTILLVLLLMLAAGLGYSVLSVPASGTGLAGSVAERLPQSGVSNPVTAVLLNFRGYDTLLEMVVLFLAVLGVRSLGGLPPVSVASMPGPVLDVLVRLLVPVLMLVAIYLLWAGSHAPGGAFQSGAVLGAAGVLLLLAGWRLPQGVARCSLRLALAAGVLVFLGVALLTLHSGGILLAYPQAQAGKLIFFIEAVASFSIGVTLAALFLGTALKDMEAP